MAIVVYPLNNIDFTAEDAGIYNATRTSGIYAGDDFSISLTGSDNIISVDVGLGWMRLSRFYGVAVALRNKTSVDMGIPDSVYPRIDALVLQFDANKNGVEIVAKPGIASSNPQPPALSQTEALYELHLAHILRKPGSTAITVSDVTDVRLDSMYCGIMTDPVSKVDTAAINAQISALIKELRDALAAVEGQTYYASKDYVATNAEAKKLLFTNISVPASAFVSAGASADYPFRASVSLSGATSGMVPEVIFGINDSTGGNFSPVSESYNGGVYLYAAAKPEENTVIPTIILWKGN